MKTHYLLADGRLIKIGRQDFINGTIMIEDGMRVVDCEMLQDDGDIYFEYGGEEIYFRDL